MRKTEAILNEMKWGLVADFVQFCLKTSSLSYAVPCWHLQLSLSTQIKQITQNSLE